MWPPYIAERDRLSRTISWVASVVWVIPQEICRASGARFRKENIVGSSSPGWHLQPRPVDRPAIQPRRRARLQPPHRQSQFRQLRCQPHVTANRPSARPTSAGRRCGSRRSGTSRPSAPPGPHANSTPDQQARPQPRHRRPDASPTTSPSIDRPARTVASNSACIASRYSRRSICARGPCTAGPLRRFSRRNWIPARSAIRPITPSSASISRTRWPLPRPPIAGLQDIAPSVSHAQRHQRGRAPMRAAAAAASAPAWPPPITMTS